MALDPTLARLVEAGAHCGRWLAQRTKNLPPRGADSPERQHFRRTHH
jgi:hypothetical protein